MKQLSYNEITVLYFYRLLDDLYRKEKMLEKLKAVIEEAKSHMQDERYVVLKKNLNRHLVNSSQSKVNQQRRSHSSGSTEAV